MLFDFKIFINCILYQSFVWGEKDVVFLKCCFECLSGYYLFWDMEYIENLEDLEEWMLLVVKYWDLMQCVVVIWIKYGVDVDFGFLICSMVEYLQGQFNFELMLNSLVYYIDQCDNGCWKVWVCNQKIGELIKLEVGFVFLGVGGGVLFMLQKFGIEEVCGYGGFLVSGQWLVCCKLEIVEQYYVKVYGKVLIGVLFMLVLYLDICIINGELVLLFGLFVGFIICFLKQGFIFDLFGLVKLINLWFMLLVSKNNMDLICYLIGEVFQFYSDWVVFLCNFFLDVCEEDWELKMVGQCVQIIKQVENGGGKFEFGIEIVVVKDGILVVLLGVLFGVFIVVNVMLDVLEWCFLESLKIDDW